MTVATQIGTPQRRGAGWFVPSGQVGYFVERMQGRWRCTCPSFRWTCQQFCKHIHAVIRHRREEVRMTNDGAANAAQARGDSMR